MRIKRVAALDLGTNTFHLVIADIAGTSFKKLIEEQRHVKLGEGGITEGRIMEPAFERGLEALRYFKSVIEENEVETIRATGTAAFRNAKNGLNFIEQAKLETDIIIEIIEGELEAELIYKGVKAVTKLKKSSLIMDIGGGSVEFIFCNDKEIFWKVSYPIGAARLMATFHHSDPISESDLSDIRDHLDKQLIELKEKAKLYKPEELLGSAGAFETFAALTADKFHIKKSDQNSVAFNLADLKSVLDDILNSTHTEREQNQLIIPVRTDMIVVASVITDYIINELNLENVRLSRFALKEGLIVSVVENTD